LAGVSHGSDGGNTLLQIRNDFPGAIGAAVIDYDDLMRYSVQPHLKVQMLNGRRDLTLFVTCWNDERKQLYRSVFRMTIPHTH
jgi:hypothetical protein